MPVTLRCSLALSAVLMFSLLATASPQAPAAPAAQDAGSDLKLPDNDAGRCVIAFLEMLADPTPERATAFETTYRSPKRIDALPMADRISMARRISDDLGKLKLREVVSVSDSVISIVAESERGESINISYEFDPEHVGKLDRISVVPVCGSAGAIKPRKLTDDRRKDIVEGVAKAVDENYVYPETGRKMAEAVRGHLKNGDYDKIEDDAALTLRLTDDMQSISDDRHLVIRLADAVLRRGPGCGSACGPADVTKDNCSFRKVEVLRGNIGYVRFDAFVDGQMAQETAAAAMGFLAHCDVLIFDLRNNGGGTPESIRFITSYLFDSRVHLNDMIDRSGKVVDEYWTLDNVPGHRFPKDLPVFVLTSSFTFSGAEEFCYNLQNLKRATVVGEKTGGGAHPVRSVRVDGRVTVNVPFMRACNPVSKTNWEGTGIQPDVPTTADEALERAVDLAKKAIGGGDERPPC